MRLSLEQSKNMDRLGRLQRWAGMSMRSLKPSSPKLVILLFASLALAACGNHTPAPPETHELHLKPRQIEVTALQAQATDERMRHFYQARGWRPVWDAATAAQLLEALDDSERHALSK